MNNLSPAAQLEAKANREHAKLAKVNDELHMLHTVIKHCELPSEVKLRLYGALRAEFERLTAEQSRIRDMREAAALSRAKQWVTRPEDG